MSIFLCLVQSEPMSTLLNLVQPGLMSTLLTYIHHEITQQFLYVIKSTNPNKNVSNNEL